MYKLALACCFVIVVSSVGVSQAQSSPRLSLRAASVEAVEGWQTMRVEHCQGERCTVWVSPTAALTESDIEQAQPEVRADGYRRVRIFFTNAGANKMHYLTEAQLKKHIVLVVDGKVLWAPTVQSTYDETNAPKDTLLAGSTGNGLSQEEVDLIMGILRPGQPR